MRAVEVLAVILVQAAMEATSTQLMAQAEGADEVFLAVEGFIDNRPYAG
jgi:hypothetical protein